MKEAIEDLITLYEKRVKTLTEMLKESVDIPDIKRFTAKRGIYYQVLEDLKRILKDEQDKT